MCHPEIPTGQETPVVDTEEIGIPIGGDRLPALLAKPSSSQQAPGVLIVGDIFGRSPFYEDLAARLAAAGFRAVLPEIFFRQGELPERTMEAARARRARLDEHQTQRDLAAAIDWIKGGAYDRVGNIGFCMGGTQSLGLSASRQDLVTVVYYGFPARLPLATELTIPPPLDQLEKISGPILGFWGDQDEAVGIANVERLRDELVARGVDIQVTVYPGLGHGFMAASGLDPGHPAFASAGDAWTKTIGFLKQHLTSGVRG